MQHWPQYTVIGLYVFELVVACVFDGELKARSRHSAGVTMVSAALSAFILWCGGFWEGIIK